MNEESKKLLDLHIGTAKHFINCAKYWKKLKLNNFACTFYLNKANEQLLMAEIYLK